MCVHAFPVSPVSAGSSSGSFAWSDDVLSCLQAPQGLVRLTGSRFSIYSTASDLDNNNVFGAGAFSAGERHFAAAAGLVRSETLPDTVLASISAARTIRGDPIGFMEGVFGPSISLGGTLGVVLTESESGGAERMLYADGGFQFSVFPTIAIGATVSNLRISGEKLSERSIGYGFTTIFDKRFRGHFSVLDEQPAVGFELDVNEWLTVRTGSGGSSWNSGVSFRSRWFRIDWAAVLAESDCRQVLGIILAPGGFK
ncbi:MAG: hypothetical protein GF388_00855 [Candidatus Aegiribacteria sp.]|nr:hypothetical protein [Candidatus Aegiribacteria sp.]MBD3293964.1 hypothetical protein [Candidatus Fermentibacteria bacterium]